MPFVNAMKRAAASGRRPPWTEVVARVIVATIGSYVVSWAAAVVAARYLPLKSPEAGLLAAMLSIFPMVGVAIAAFSVRSIWAFAAALCALAAVLFAAAGLGARQ